MGRYGELQRCAGDVQRAFEALRATFAAGGTLLVCGNGGSAADADHLVGELMKGFVSRRPVGDETRTSLLASAGSDGAYLADSLQGALRAISLSAHTALATAIANDVAADMVYAQQVHGFGRAGDALLAISTSGESLNVVRAAQVARAAGLTVIGLTGAAGGRLAGLCDVCIRVPYSSVTEVQERHLSIYHALSLMLEREFFPVAAPLGAL